MLKLKNKSTSRKICNFKCDNLLIEPVLKINFPRQLNLNKIRKREEEFENIMNSIDKSMSE